MEYFSGNISDIGGQVSIQVVNCIRGQFYQWPSISMVQYINGLEYQWLRISMVKYICGQGQ